MSDPLSTSQIARIVLEDTLSEWTEGLDYYIEEMDNSINFIIQIDTTYGPTIVFFNPQAVAEQIVEACRRQLEKTELWKLERYRERFLRSRAGWAIKELLASARLQFEDFIWELPLVSVTRFECAISTPDRRKQLVDELLDHIIKRRKERFNLRERGRPSVVADEMVYYAIEHLGGTPSQAAVAQFLKISPKALRGWRKRQGFTHWKVLLESLKGGRKY
jgi:hypothetical protein